METGDGDGEIIRKQKKERRQGQREQWGRGEALEDKKKKKRKGKEER